MKVTVTDGRQVNHDGTVYRGGQTLEVDEPTGQRWVARGWVQPAETSPKRRK